MLSRIKTSYLIILLLTLLTAFVSISTLGRQQKQAYVKTCGKAVMTVERNNSDHKNELHKDTGSWLAYSENWNEEILVRSQIADKTITFTDEYRLKMMSKGLHPLNLKHQYLHDRIDRVWKYCNVFLTKSNGEYKLLKGYYKMRFSDKSQLLQCAMLKVSSTTWIEIFRELEGVTKQPYPYPNLWQRIAVNFNYKNPMLTAQRYQTYTKFLIVRNPIQRLLSAYTDKFITRFQYGETYKYAIIRSNYLSHLTEETITQMRQELKTEETNLTKGLSDEIIRQIRRLDAGYGKSEITFLEFLNYIISIDRANGWNGFDPHWRPMNIYCDPCSIRYDIIAKFETLKEDSDAILNYIQIHNPGHNITFPEHDSTTSTDRCNEAFRSIPLNVRRSLYEIYKQDFLIFGYEYREDGNNKFC